MSQFGLAPFGTGNGPFGGPGVITIVGVLPVAANELIAVFDKRPTADDPGAFDSSTNLKNWTLTPIDPTIESTTVPGQTYVEKGKIVPTRTQLFADAFQDDDDGTQIHLTLDSRLEDGVVYELEALPAIIGEDCETLVGPTAFEFIGLRPGPSRRARFVQEDRFRDWDNDFFPADPKQPAGTWRLEDSGDIGLQNADKSLRKRILRRILTNPNGFKHLDNYGTNTRIKSLIRTGQVQALANAVQQQVALEPDVAAAAATARIANISGAGAVVALEVFVQRKDSRDSRFLFEFPLT